MPVGTLTWAKLKDDINLLGNVDNERFQWHGFWNKVGITGEQSHGLTENLFGNGTAQ